MTNEELVRAALEKVGGKSNVLTATNCMTRLRVRVKDDAKIDDEGLKAIEGVMGIVHDRTGYVEIVVGPGKCRKCADICRDMGIPADAAASTANDWQTNKAAVKAGQKQSKVKELFKTFGDIFIPLIPGVVASGLCAGINSLIGQVVPNYADIPALALISTLLGLMNTCFLGYLTAWVGYRAAEKFGGTPHSGRYAGHDHRSGGHQQDLFHSGSVQRGCAAGFHPACRPRRRSGRCAGRMVPCQDRALGA